MSAAFDFHTQAAQVLNSVGVELVIFAITVFFALVIRATSNSTSIKRTSKAKVVDPVLPSIPSVATGKARQLSCSSNSSSDDDSAPCQRLQQVRRQPLNNQRSQRPTREQQPWELIERITTIMRDNATQASAAQALQLYSELRSSIGLGEGKMVSAVEAFVEAARRSKQNAGNLYVLLVQCAVRSKQCHLVEQLIKDMKALSVPRSLVFYESAMKQLAGQKQHQLALVVYDHLHADGMEPSVVSYSCLIGFAAEVGENQRAVYFFEMLSKLATPSIRAYMTVLRVYAKLQDWAASANALRDMKKRNVRIDSLVLNVALATGIAAGKLEEVENMLNEASSEDGSVADVVSYNTLIKGYSKNGESQAAVRVKARMDSLGISPSIITFNTLMDALVRDKKLDQAWGMLQDMRGNGLQPDRYTCSIMVKGLGKQPTNDHIRKCAELLFEVKDKIDATLKSTLYHTVFQVVAQSTDDVLLMQIVTQMRQEKIEMNDVASRKLRERLRSVTMPP